MRRVAFVLVALLCGFAPHPRSLAPSKPLPVLAGVESRDVALPIGFAAAVDRATRAQFVHVVAGDVDRDGDIDVVASLGSLDLIVWKNDGAGHFTRQEAAPHLSVRQQPPAPSVNSDSSASNEWIQNDQPRGVDLDALRADADDAPGIPFAWFVRVAKGRYGPRVQPARAPPTDPLL